MSRRLMKPEERFPDLYYDVRLKRSQFDQSYTVDPATGCWNWFRGKHRQGYGMMGAYRLADQKDIMITAHRASWRIFHGPITQPNIIHTCNNVACVNPAHLKAGTQKETVEKVLPDGRRIIDIRKPRRTAPEGRSTYARRKTFLYRWTEEEIQFFRTASTTEIAEKYNCTRPEACRRRYYCRTHYPWLPMPDSVKQYLENKKSKGQ